MDLIKSVVVEFLLEVVQPGYMVMHVPLDGDEVASPPSRTVVAVSRGQPCAVNYVETMNPAMIPHG